MNSEILSVGEPQAEIIGLAASMGLWILGRI